MVEYKNKAFEPQQKVVQTLKGGIDLSKPAYAIDDTAASDLINVQLRQGVMRADTGYKTYRQPLLFGVPMGEFQFLKTDGSLTTLLITTKTLLKDNGTQWEFCCQGNALTTNEIASNNNQFTLASTTNYSVGAWVGIRLDNATQFQTQVQAIVGQQITTTTSVPVGRTAIAGGDVVLAPVFNGSAAIQPSGVTWPITNWFIFTNGVDPPWKFDGLAVNPLGGTPPVCQALTEFHGFLVLGNTEDGLGTHPTRMQNSDLDNPENWTTGLAFFVDLADTEDPILDLELLGPWLIIYRHNSVMRRSYIGDLAELFYDEYTLQGMGISGPGCVAVTGANHVFFGAAGFFSYQGGYNVEDIGGQVFDSVFGVAQGDFNDKLETQSFCFYVSELDEVWFFYPTTLSKGFCDKLLRYSLGDDSWWIRKLANEISGFGFIEAVAGRTWLQATCAWNKDVLAWNSRANTEFAPLTLLCDPYGLQTFIYDYVSISDNGTTQTWRWASKDFQSPQYLLRLDGIRSRGVGNNILVEVSADSGLTFRTVGTINFGLSESTQTVNYQIVGDSLRVRFSGNDPTFSLNWFRIDFFEETPW